MPNADIFVRALNTDDSAVLENHVRLAKAEASQYRGANTNSPDQGTLTLHYVAGVGQTIMASLSASGSKDTSVFIHHVFVVPEAREIGLGDALLLHLLDELRALGVTNVSAHALPGDRAMKNLFERHGLVAQTIIVGKSL
jgi:GNAT superfamily N-acetyltransferase